MVKGLKGANKKMQLPESKHMIVTSENLNQICQKVAKVAPVYGNVFLFCFLLQIQSKKNLNTLNLCFSALNLCSVLTVNTVLIYQVSQSVG